MSNHPKVVLAKRYRFINIRQNNDETFEGHAVYRVFNNRSNVQLGILSFYKPWKEYVFSAIPECVFNDSCLKNVLDFMQQIAAIDAAKEKP